MLVPGFDVAETEQIFRTIQGKSPLGQTAGFAMVAAENPGFCSFVPFCSA